EGRVILSGDTVFQVFAPFGSFSAAERARAVSSRLQEIIREPHFYPDSLVSSIIENDYYILF
ncbi:MAG: hypothetical protein MUF85_02075, partial [Patescibacteria group bacterium]|nr:hypothetical protein [Patescibacteria group bacterium]